MSDNTHRIMRQILELDFGSTDQFADLQQVAERVLKNQGLTTMKTVFDQVAGPHERLRLERLELDLGTLRGTDWPEQFKRRLAEQLERQLGQVLQEQADKSTTASTADSLFEQFLYFCQWGCLPWWGRQPSATWLEQLSTTITSVQWQTLADYVQNDRRIQQRLIYTVSDDFLQGVLQRFSQLPEASRVQQQLGLSTWSSTTQALWRERFWSMVLIHIPVSTVAAGRSLVRHLLAERQRLLESDPPASSPVINVEHSTRHSRNQAVGDLPSLPAPWQTWLHQAIQVSESTRESTNIAASSDEPSFAGASPEETFFR